jgi:hypothetical protein
MMLVLKKMKNSSIELGIEIWNIPMEGYSRAEGERDRKKALSIWRYLSGQQTHEEMGMNLPRKASTVLPDATTLATELDVCKFGRFEKEADKVWMFGQKNERIVLEANTLTSYVEALASFGKKRADRAVELILLGVKGEKMPLRNVAPDKKTINHATGCLRGNDWVKHADIIDAVAKDGDQETAEVIDPDIVTYESMMYALLDGYAYSCKLISKMLNVMKEMNESCVTPNIKFWKQSWKDILGRWEMRLRRRLFPSGSIYLVSRRTRVWGSIFP